MEEEEGTDLVQGALSEDMTADEKYKAARREISDLIHNRVEDKIDAIDLLARVDHMARTIAEFNQVDGPSVLRAFGVGLDAFLQEPSVDAKRRSGVRPR